MGGPLVHLPDPTHGSVIEVLAAALAPRFRVLSIHPRADRPFQVQVDDLEGVLTQFGFEHIVLAAEGLSCTSALLLAAWYPRRVAAMALIDPDLRPPTGDSLTARSLRECPPDWPRLRELARCTIVELAGDSPSLVSEIERLLTSGLP